MQEYLFNSNSWQNFNHENIFFFFSVRYKVATKFHDNLWSKDILVRFTVNIPLSKRYICIYDMAIL